MTNPRVEKSAHLLVNYCIEVQPGARVAINGTSAALPLINETLRAVVRAGGLSYIHWREERFTEILLKEASVFHLSYA